MLGWDSLECGDASPLWYVFFGAPLAWVKQTKPKAWTDPRTPNLPQAVARPTPINGRGTIPKPQRGFTHAQGAVRTGRPDRRARRADAVGRRPGVQPEEGGPGPQGRHRPRHQAQGRHRR